MITVIRMRPEYRLYRGDLPLEMRLQVADTFATRFMGLMGKKCLPPQTGLLLRNCPSVHMCFMRFSLDILYFSADGQALAVETLRPWRLGSRVRGARHVVEAPAGTFDDIAELHLVEMANPAEPQGCSAGGTEHAAESADVVPSAGIAR